MLYLLVTLGLAACGGEDGTPTTAATAPPATVTVPPATPTAASPTATMGATGGEAGRQVQYRISGSVKTVEVIYVRYEGASGQSVQARVDVPWNESFEAREGEQVYISAQPKDGSVTCEITLDGKSFKKDRSSASDPVASCDGVIGEK